MVKKHSRERNTKGKPALRENQENDRMVTSQEKDNDETILCEDKSRQLDWSESTSWSMMKRACGQHPAEGKSHNLSRQTDQSQKRMQ